MHKPRSQVNMRDQMEAADDLLAEAENLTKDAQLHACVLPRALSQQVAGLESRLKLRKARLNELRQEQSERAQARISARSLVPARLPVPALACPPAASDCRVACRAPKARSGPWCLNLLLK
jgi:hypothetical protein